MHFTIDPDDGQIVLAQAILPYHFIFRSIKLFFIEDDLPSSLLLIHSSNDILKKILLQKNIKSITSFDKNSSGEAFILKLRNQANYLKHYNEKTLNYYIEIEFIYNFMIFVHDTHSLTQSIPQSLRGLYKTLHKKVFEGTSKNFPPSEEEIRQHVNNYRKYKYFIKFYVLIIFSIQNFLYDKELYNSFDKEIRKKL
jgi:hypothetical protein